MTMALAGFEDRTLIKMALDGHGECFTVLMDRHLAAVRGRIVARIRNESDTDDLLQEVQLKVWRALATFRAESSFRTWMTRIAINEMLQLFRREHTRPACVSLENLHAIASGGESQLRSLERDEEIKELRQAVVKLPPRYRRILALRDLEELTTKETADELQSTVPAIKTRLFRARQLLLMELKRTSARKLPRAA